MEIPLIPGHKNTTHAYGRRLEMGKQNVTLKKGRTRSKYLYHIDRQREDTAQMRDCPQDIPWAPVDRSCVK